MKVLISAYACEPDAGSEPGTGWAWARAAAFDNDVWLLTRANNAGPIEVALGREPGLRLRPVYIDLPQWARRWKKGQRGVHLYYLLWQVLAWRVARDLHSRERFDLAHHLTFATDWMPAGVAFVPQLPCVWGPVGGSTPTPWSLWRWLGLRGLLGEIGRTAGTGIGRRIAGVPSCRRSRVLVAQNLDVAQRFRKVARLTIVEPNVAIAPEPDRARLNLAWGPSSGGQRDNATTQSRRALFVGRCIPWKGLRLAVAALAEPEALGWTLEVFGNGPEVGAAMRLAERLGVRDRVMFLGARPRAEVLDAMRTADALVHPSMHDAASWCVAEALQLGCPVVCLDRGGPPILVRRSGVGTTVAVSKDAVRHLGLALGGLAGRMPETTRWADSRLPAHLRQLYVLASSGRTQQDLDAFSGATWSTSGDN